MEQAGEVAAPTFSPDSQWIAFFADGKLKKISVEGGSPITLCDAPNPRGLSWGEDGNLLFAANNRSPLSRVSSAGGTPQEITKFDNATGGVTNRFGQLLPGGKAFLFTSSKDNNSYDQATIEVQTVDGGQRKTLLTSASFAR